MFALGLKLGNEETGKFVVGNVLELYDSVECVRLWDSLPVGRPSLPSFPVSTCCSIHQERRSISFPLGPQLAL